VRACALCGVRRVIRVVDGPSALFTAVTAVTHSATCLHQWSLIVMWCGASIWVNSSCLYYYLGTSEQCLWSIVVTMGLTTCISLFILGVSYVRWSAAVCGHTLCVWGSVESVVVLGFGSCSTDCGSAWSSALWPLQLQLYVVLVHYCGVHAVTY